MFFNISPVGYCSDINFPSTGGLGAFAPFPRVLLPNPLNETFLDPTLLVTSNNAFFLVLRFLSVRH